MDYRNVIEIHGLCKKQGDFALKDVDIVLPKGCVMGYIGQNGAGKTTTIKAMLNRIEIDSGSIKIFGMDYIKNEGEIKEEIGVVYDELMFHDKLKVKQIGTILKHIYKKWNQPLYEEYLSRFKLQGNKKVKELSRGMRMKLQIATALSHDAKLLIMDEPTGGLDPIVRNEILDIFMDFMQDESHSILLSSHITTDLERIADYLTFIDDGEVMLSGEKFDILENHGIIKCGKDGGGFIDNDDIVFCRESVFGKEIMVKNKSKYGKVDSGTVMEDAGLEDIMMFYVERRRKGSAGTCI